MRILVDGDAAGRREIVVALAIKHQAELHWVSNPSQRPPQAREGLKLVHHLSDADSQATDVVVMNLSSKGDVIITADLGLAAVCLARGAAALSPRGLWYYEDRLAAQLEFRHLASRRRRGGRRVAGPRPSRNFDEQRFEEELRRALSGA